MVEHAYSLLRLDRIRSHTVRYPQLFICLFTYPKLLLVMRQENGLRLMASGWYGG